MPKEWEKHKAEIRRLYLDDQMNLVDVIKLMSQKHGFIASESSYRNQMKKWGYGKYNTANRPRSLTTAFDRAQHHEQPMQTMNVPKEEDSCWESHVGDIEPRPSQASLAAWADTSTTHSNTFLPQYQYFFQQNYADLDARDHTGKTQLHNAVIQRSNDLVQNLMIAGASIHIKDKIGNEALHYAVSYGADDITNILLDYGADINAKGRDGMTAVHTAVTSSTLLKLLLKHNPDLTLQNNQGLTPLHLAVQHLLPTKELESPSGLSSIKLLFEAGADVNQSDPTGASPFHRFINRSGRLDPILYLDMLNLFLQHGADVVNPCWHARLPFDMFLTSPHFQWPSKIAKSELGKFFTQECCIHGFLKNGANVHTFVEGNEPFSHKFLHETLVSNIPFQPALFHFICTMAEPHFRGHGDRSLLHIILPHILTSIQKTDLMEGVKILIKNGANPNQEDVKGQSPLFSLISSQGSTTDPTFLSLVQTILEHGADPMMRNFSGSLPIYEAARCPGIHTAQLSKMLLSAAFSCDESMKQARKYRSRKYHQEDYQYWDELEVSIRQAIPSLEYWVQKKFRLQTLKECICLHSRDIAFSSSLSVLAIRLVQLLNKTSSYKEESRRFIAFLIKDLGKEACIVDQTLHNALVDLCLIDHDFQFQF